MLKTIGKYIEVGKMEFKVGLAYIAQSYAGILVGLLQIAIFYYIWKTIYKTNTMLGGISYKQMITYVVVSRIIFAAFQWSISTLMAGMIIQGEIGVQLARPLDFQSMILAGSVGGSVFNTLIFNGIPMFLVSAIFLKILIPHSVVTWLLFFLSLVLAIITSFLADFILGTFTLWTENGWALQIIREALLNFFSGALIPIALFPGWLKAVANILPFKAMVSIPVNVFVGTINMQDALSAIGLQIVWIAVLLVISRLFWAKAIKRVTVYGG